MHLPTHPPAAQAQELGEQSRFRDDAMWALDGLCMSGSPNTLRESALALLDICATKRGRLALRSGGVAEEVLATLGACGGGGWMGGRWWWW